MFYKLTTWLSCFWSSTDFETDELTQYAEKFMLTEVCRGVYIMGAVTLLLLIAAAALYGVLEYSDHYLYTCAMLALLSMHVIYASRKVSEIKALYLLCMTLIIVSGVAFLLLAHREGSFNNALLPPVVVLFMVIPIIPWGLREGLAIVSLIYLVFTLSTMSVGGRFDSENLLILQFMMMASAMLSLTILSRNVTVRKEEIKARYELEVAHRNMERLSYEDGLTGAWNRRYLEVQFKRVLRRFQERTNSKIYFGLLDVDDFKQINDLHGHIAGDDVLKNLTDVFNQSLGESSYVFRIGGDEFAILFESSDHNIPLQQATEKLREPSITATGVNVSIGVIEVQGFSSEISLEKLYKEADKSLYKAKTHKRSNDNQLNCVTNILQLAEAV